MIHGMTLCLHRGSTPTRNPSANDVVLTILIRDGVSRSRRRSSIGRSLVVRSASLDRLLLLRQQLRQRRKRHRWKGHAPLQSVEQPAETLVDNDLTSALKIGPDRLPRAHAISVPLVMMVDQLCVV